MKNIFKITIAFLIFNCQFSIINAQIAINEDGSNPDSSAILDISSTDKGVLVPRMTTSERTAISSPATGLLVFDTTTNTFWFYSNSTWTAIGTGAFTSENGITYLNNNNDDFIIGADSLNFGSGAEIKLFFDKSKGAFRAGKIGNTLWDESSVGDYSIAFGIDTEASGNVTTAFGADTKSSGFAATAFGYATTASGYTATAFGYNTAASGFTSTAFGYATTAPSYAETVFGVYNTNYTANNTTDFNSNDRLFVIGNGTDNNSRSDAIIIYKSGKTEINGALTINNEYTLPTTDGTANEVLTTDGNGTVSWSSNIFSSTNNIIATHYSHYGDDFIIGSADTLNHGNGSETKLFFDNSKGAFRAGVVNSTFWDESQIGYYSVALGENTVASDICAVAFGFESEATEYGAFAGGLFNVASGEAAVGLGIGNTASANYATAIGRTNTASKNSATAFGWSNEANGNASFVVGRNNIAEASYSAAMGFNLLAPSYCETVIGVYNTYYTPIDTNSFNTNDRIFTIGNGTGSTARSDAMVIYKNGNTELNGTFTVSDTTTINKPLIVNDLVGIGTTPTNADLEVAYSGNGDYFSLSSIGYLNTGGSGTGTYTGRFAIYADGRISGTAFIAHSDKRIKNIIGKTNNENDLAILNNIEITNYTMKDNIRYGDKMVKKVIAQQVAEVYPQAVTTNTTEIVPDIYQQATMDKNGWIVFNPEVSGQVGKLKMENGKLEVGEKVQIIFEDKKELLEILEIKENAFRVKPITNYESPITIFIYGRQVQDFHTVDYEAISMLNVSATQQLAKEVEQLKKENEQLKMQLQKINELETQLEQIQAQLNNQ